MADTQQSYENGKRSAATATGASIGSTPALKKMKIEEDTPPEVCVRGIMVFYCLHMDFYSIFFSTTRRILTRWKR